MLSLDALSLITNEECYKMFFGRCPYCLSWLYVERVLTVDKKGNERWTNIKYVGLPTLSKQYGQYKKAFETLFGAFPLPASYDEERNMLVLPARLFRRIVEAYGTPRFKDFEWLLVKMGDVDMDYLTKIILKARLSSDERKE